MNNIKLIILIFISCMLCACGFFDKDNTPPPSPLVSFTPEATVQSTLYESAGSGVDDEYLKLGPAIATASDTIITTSKNGTIVATDLTSGKTRWKIRIKESISSSPAVSNHTVIVGTEEGNVYAFREEDGKILWKVPASSEVFATPAIEKNVVFVKSIDGRLTAFSTLDGHALWHYQQTEPTLILRGASAPALSRGSVVVGFANGNLVKLTQQGGNLLWEEPLAIPEGSFTIQRMIDIDADPIVSGNRIYAATYQGKIAALDFASGKAIWSHDLSSYTGMALDEERIYITDAKSHLFAFDKSSGIIDWRQTQLEARNITAPAVMGRYIVVGDMEGYLHWLSKTDGHFIARTRVNRSGILANPIVYHQTVYVVTRDGHLAGYTIKP